MWKSGIFMSRNKSQKYNNDSIKSLKGADRVRKRPGVILGRTESKVVNIQSLKSYQTRLTKPGRAMEPKSISQNSTTDQLK